MWYSVVCFVMHGSGQSELHEQQKGLLSLCLWLELILGAELLPGNQALALGLRFLKGGVACMWVVTTSLTWLMCVYKLNKLLLEYTQTPCHWFLLHWKATLVMDICYCLTEKKKENQKIVCVSFKLGTFLIHGLSIPLSKWIIGRLDCNSSMYSKSIC